MWGSRVVAPDADGWSSGAADKLGNAQQESR